MAKKAYIGVPTPQKSLADVTVGETVQLNENGTPVDFYVAKHDYESELNGTGRTLLVRKDCYDSRVWHDSSNQNLYASSSIDSWLNGTYKELLDADVRNVIGVTKFYYTPGRDNTTVTTLERVVFLLSVTELDLSISGANIEGSPLPIASSLQIAYRNGSESGQWTRTPHTSRYDNAFFLNTGGTATGSSITSSFGSRPAFTLPSNLAVTNGLVTGAEPEVKSVARKVKKMYLGIPTDLPIYSEETRTVAITADNIADYFNVTNGSSYYFAGSGDTFTSNNAGVDNSTATTVLTAKQDISALSFNYSYSSEANYDKFTLKMAGTTVENAVSGATTSKSYSGSLAAGQTIEFTYAKDSSQSKNDDKCTFSAMEVTATVRTQTGTETKSVARKVKKAYIGIGGVARPCFGGGELAYYGTITPLSVARQWLSATSVGNHALFAGGYGSATSAVVDAYDKSLARTIPTALSVARHQMGAASNKSYAVFAGGQTAVGSGGAVETVDAYDSSLTRSTPTTLYTAFDVAGTTLGNLAVFAGGYSYSSKPTYYKTVAAYNTSLTKTTSALSFGRQGMGAGTVGNYAVFAGGSAGNGSGQVQAWACDESMTVTAITSLSQEHFYMGSASIGNHVLFAGGQVSVSSNTDVCEAYDTSLTRSTLTKLSSARTELQGVSIGDFALFAGGDNGSKSTIVDIYDLSLTRKTGTSLSEARSRFATTAIGDYALFGGGVVAIDTVEAYVLT